MSQGQEHPYYFSDGAKQLAVLRLNWDQPCCGCPGGSDEHVSVIVPNYSKSTKNFQKFKLKEFSDKFNI